MNGHGLAEAIGAFALFGGLAAVLAVGIWQLGRTMRAKVEVGGDSEYRELAARAVKAQESADRRLDEIVGQIADLQAQMTFVERVLKDTD